MMIDVYRSSLVYSSVPVDRQVKSVFRVFPYHNYAGRQLRVTTNPQLPVENTAQYCLYYPASNVETVWRYVCFHLPLFTYKKAQG